MADSPASRSDDGASKMVTCPGCNQRVRYDAPACLSKKHQFGGACPLHTRAAGEALRAAQGTDDELFKRWNSLWLKANEEASAEMFNRETLPPNHQAVLQAKALRRTIIAFAATFSERGTRDTERLDFIERMGINQNWVSRHSTTGRGYRLHNDKDGTALSARAAIDTAMREQQGERDDRSHPHTPRKP